MFCDGGLACGFSQPISQSGRNTHDKKDPGPAPAPARDVHPVQCRNRYTCYARGGTLNKCAEMMQASKGSSRMTDGQGNSFVRLMRGGEKKKGDGLDFCSCNCRRPASVALVTKSFFFFSPC